MRRRVDLRRRVLTPSECGTLGSVSGVTEQEEVLLRFSMKEAVYKAAHPFLRRPLGFKDVSTCRLFCTLVGVEGVLREARWTGCCCPHFRCPLCRVHGYGGEVSQQQNDAFSRGHTRETPHGKHDTDCTTETLLLYQHRR